MLLYATSVQSFTLIKLCLKRVHRKKNHIKPTWVFSIDQSMVTNGVFMYSFASYLVIWYKKIYLSAQKLHKMISVGWRMKLLLSYILSGCRRLVAVDFPTTFWQSHLYISPLRDFIKDKKQQESWLPCLLPSLHRTVQSHKLEKSLFMSSPEFVTLG